MTSPADPDFTAREALRLIGPDPDNWVTDRPGVDHNVLIVGGGQTGSVFAFALRRAGIGKVSVIDAAADESRAGIWLTRARMQRLRTPKSLPGPELGLTGLSFQSWYEARHGAEAYAAFDRIARTDWAAYLSWYRRTLGITVRYGVKLERIEPTGDFFRAHLSVNGQARVETARKIILGNGVISSGGPVWPDVLSGLPRELWAHTSDQIDFPALRGKSVAVVGAAASAFDAAGVALESGAREVHLFGRREKLASVPINRVRGYPGAYDNYALLPDAVRWKQALRYRDAGSTPPPDAVARVVKHHNFHLHLGAAWTEALSVGGQVETRVRDESFRFDFVIAGTGYFANPNVRPELADFAAQIRLWRDQYQPPEPDADGYFGAHPYLGLAHEYLERTPGSAPWLRDIHVYNPSGFVSFGLPIGDVPSIRRDVPVIVRAISRDLFLADLDAHERRITGPAAPEFDEALYERALWKRTEPVAAE